MKRRIDVSHWLFQYILGFIVGGLVGGGAVLQYRDYFESIGLFSVAGALLLAGAASFWGDDVWYYLINEIFVGALSSSAPYDPLEHNFWIYLRTCSGIRPGTGVATMRNWIPRACDSLYAVYNPPLSYCRRRTVASISSSSQS